MRTQTQTMYRLTIQTDMMGEDVYYCETMAIVKGTVFSIFTDWSASEDDIDDIDCSLRERCEGFIEVEEIEVKKDIRPTLTEVVKYFPCNQATKETASTYVDRLSAGISAPIYDFEIFQTGIVPDDLIDTYQHYVKKGVQFDRLIELLTLMSNLGNVRHYGVAYVG